MIFEECSSRSHAGASRSRFCAVLRIFGRIVRLTAAYKKCIIICIRTTLNIDDALLARAREYTGKTEKTALVRMGLEALIEREAARRLAALGGAMPSLRVPARRRLQRRRHK
jgi:Arc/MetJ family transcription regulator